MAKGQQASEGATMWASSTLRVLLTKVRPIIGRGGALVASGSVLQCPSRITGAVAVPNDPSSTRKLIATESSRFHGMGFFTFLAGVCVSSMPCQTDRDRVAMQRNRRVEATPTLREWNT